MTVLKNGNDVRASEGDRIIAKSVWGIEPRMMFVHFLGGVLMKGETVNIDNGRLLCFCFFCTTRCAHYVFWLLFGIL